MISRGAILSDDGKYRYVLHRQWGKCGPLLALIGLNPSTADHVQDDPTMRREIDFARREGYGGLVKLNLFAFRATQPADMMTSDDPVGPQNDYWLRRELFNADTCWVVWGVNGTFQRRDAAVRAIIYDSWNRHEMNVECFGVTKGGQPKHPLYLSKETPLVSYGCGPRMPDET